MIKKYIYFPIDLIKQAEKQAKKECMTFSSYVRACVLKGLQETKKNKKDG